MQGTKPWNPREQQEEAPCTGKEQPWVDAGTLKEKFSPRKSRVMGEVEHQETKRPEAARKSQNINSKGILK